MMLQNIDGNIKEKRIELVPNYSIHTCEIALSSAQEQTLKKAQPRRKFVLKLTRKGKQTTCDKQIKQGYAIKLTNKHVYNSSLTSLKTFDQKHREIIPQTSAFCSHASNITKKGRHEGVVSSSLYSI